MTWYQIRSWFWRVAMICHDYLNLQRCFIVFAPLPPTAAAMFLTHMGVLLRDAFCYDNYCNKKWLSSYPVYWRNANSQNYFWPNGLWQIGNIWSTTERNKNTTIGCVVPAWSTRGNPKLCRGKPKLCRGKSKLCRGPTNPKISQNHVRSENVGLNLWKTFKNMMFGSVTICWTIFGVTLWCP